MVFRGSFHAKTPPSLNFERVINFQSRSYGRAQMHSRVQVSGHLRVETWKGQIWAISNIFNNQLVKGAT